MANPLRKTMVYLGLADEELEYEDQQREPARPQPAPAAAAAPAPVAPVHAAPSSAPAPSRAPVTPLRRASTPKNTVPSDMNEILTVHPREYKDAQAIAESFRDGIPVIINLSQMTESDARRLVDFASGLSQGLYGKIERVTAKVFLLSPAHIAVSGEQAEVESDIEASFFTQS
ncbi:cell division protein SepF [Frigoribacterium salinisoli]